MKEIEHRGITHVIFQSNSNSVVDIIHNLHCGNHKFNSLTSHIKNVLYCL
jgi:hypothetical protein